MPRPPQVRGWSASSLTRCEQPEQPHEERPRAARSGSASLPRVEVGSPPGRRRRPRCAPAGSRAGPRTGSSPGDPDDPQVDPLALVLGDDRLQLLQVARHRRQVADEQDVRVGDVVAVEQLAREHETARDRSSRRERRPRVPRILRVPERVEPAARAPRRASGRQRLVGGVGEEDEPEVPARRPGSAASSAFSIGAGELRALPERSRTTIAFAPRPGGARPPRRGREERRARRARRGGRPARRARARPAIRRSAARARAQRRRVSASGSRRISGPPRARARPSASSSTAVGRRVVRRPGEDAALGASASSSVASSRASCSSARRRRPLSPFELPPRARAASAPAGGTGGGA